MKIKSLGALALAACLIIAPLALGTAAYAAVPTNDDVANALELPSLPFSGDFDTADATWSPSDPDACPNSSSVWFAFTPDRDMTVKLSGAGSSYEPSFTVLTGPIDSMSVVACRYQGAQQPLLFPATSGTTYRIMVATCCSYQGSSLGGALHLSISEVVPPPNDDIANAAVVGPLPYSPAPVDTTAATTEESDPTSCSAFQSVWYEYQPSKDVGITVETTGYQTSVSVWTGAPDALTSVGCGSGFSGARFQLTGGQHYWIMIASTYPPPGGGLLGVTIRETNEIVGVAINSTATVTAEGTATVSGTVTCSSSGPIDVVVQLSETFKRPPGTVWGQGSTTVQCHQSATWSVQITPVGVGFAKGDASARAQAISVDTFNYLLTTKDLKLKKS
ncbi:hypothetical protein AAIB33_13105 [Microbacterium sp. AZCO]|uniref:hypothetical protein n=1 Tax=Microbacterium sp. AZCO TaxID=3142976 RepID=UPI0031F3FDBE